MTKREKFKLAVEDLLKNHSLKERFIQEYQPDKEYFQVTIGDWSEDGHEKYDCFIVSTDTPVDEVQRAFIKTIEDHKLCVDNGHELDFLDDYGVYYIQKKYCDVLNAIIPNLDKILNGELDENVPIYPSDLVHILMEIAKVNLPNFEYEIKKGVSDIKFNGWWNETLNCGYGYGLWN